MVQTIKSMQGTTGLQVTHGARELILPSEQSELIQKGLRPTEPPEAAGLQTGDNFFSNRVVGAKYNKKCNDSDQLQK
jgi:hypothetical protein